MPAVPSLSPPSGVPVAPSPLPPDAPTRVTRALAMGLLVGLVLLGLAWELWLSPTGRGTWAVKVLPLLPALPGLWRWRLYTYRWLSLLVWLYIAEGLVRAGSEHGTGAAMATTQVLVGVALFAACAIHVRWRLKRAAR
ncbi:DUF2069 domain-containing protein [Ideonella sp. YS5]|uniref:DUF2069 domain-containing protein n=1 Tax=Ideonella sp. YS5 TaxID=3453714 RepID=UPI003EEF3187